MTKYWADVIPYPAPSGGGGGGGGGQVTITTSPGYLPVVTVTTLDHAPLSGPVEAGTGTIIEVIGSLTGTDLSAAITASGTGTVEFLGDVLVSAVQVNGGTLVTTGTLTLDAASTLGSPSGTLHLTGALSTALPTGSLLNQGSIDLAAVAGSTAQSIDLAALTNAGGFSLGAGDTLDISAPSFSNAGSLAIGAGASLDLVSADFSNTGSISLASGATFSLALASTLPGLAARLGSIENSGGTLAIQLTGSLDNGGAVFNLASAEAEGVIGLGRPGDVPGTRPYPSGGYVRAPNRDGIAATLAGGTLEAGGTLHVGGGYTPGIRFSNTTLDNVDVRGVLELGAGDSLTVAGSTSFSEAMTGRAIGDINLAGDGASLSFAAATTLDHTAILVSNGAGSIAFAVPIEAGSVEIGAPAGTISVVPVTGIVSLDAPPVAQAVITANAGLTIGSDSEIAVLTGQTYTSLNANGGFTNLGTIQAAGTVVIGASAGFVNDGLLTLVDGARTVLFGDYSGAGRIALAGNDTLQIAGAVDAADITLAGTNNTIVLDTPPASLTMDGLALGDTLSLSNTTPVTSARYASGHLILYSNGDPLADIATTDDLTAATLLITPTLTGGTLSIVATGALDTATLPTQTAAERLIIGTSRVTNAGTLHIADVGVVEFQGAVTDAGTIAFDGATGSLVLDHPQGFHASISAMQVGDSITLAPGTGYSLAYTGETLEVMQNGTLAASLTLGTGHDITDFTLNNAGLAPSIAMIAPTGTGPASQTFSYADITDDTDAASHGDSYSGPVAGLTGQFIHVTTHNTNVATRTANVFIRTGSGDDAVQVSSGDNVIDASTGSNFLVGGSGHDTFFVDARDPGAIWDTIVNFHQGDAVTIWGYTAGTSAMSWADNLGAAGYQGLTLQIAADGSTMLARATFASLTAADESSFRIQTGSIAGNDYLSIVHL